jgi:hypothetical protein
MLADISFDSLLDRYSLADNAPTADRCRAAGDWFQSAARTSETGGQEMEIIIFGDTNWG